MEKQLDVLKKLVETNQFHHATYRNEGTLWEGLWFYKRSATGFRGYEVAGSVLKNDPDLDAAYRLVGGTGIGRGSYGCG